MGELKQVLDRINSTLNLITLSRRGGSKNVKLIPTTQSLLGIKYLDHDYHQALDEMISAPVVFYVNSRTCRNLEACHCQLSHIVTSGHTTFPSISAAETNLSHSFTQIDKLWIKHSTSFTN